MPTQPSLHNWAALVAAMRGDTSLYIYVQCMYYTCVYNVGTLYRSSYKYLALHYYFSAPFRQNR